MLDFAPQGHFLTGQCWMLDEKRDRTMLDEKGKECQ